MLVPLDKIKYHHIHRVSQIDDLEKCLLKQRRIGIDCETTGQDKLHRVHVKLATIFGVSIYFPHHAIWIEQLHEDNQFTQRVFQFLRNILSRKDFIKVLHNAAFDYNVLWKKSVIIQPPIYDSQIMANLYDENDLRGGLSEYKIGTKDRWLPLKPLAWKYLGWKYDMLDFEDRDITEYPLPERLKYGCNDSIACYYLARFYYPHLKNQNLLEVFKLESDIIPARAHMQKTGIKIDVPYLLKKKPEIERDLKRMEAKIQKIAGVGFNVRSTKQLREVLFDKLKLPIKMHTDGGKSKEKKASTDVNALTQLQQSNPHPILDELLFQRKVEQLRKMYLKPFVTEHLMSDGRIYPQFPQSHTVTGRLSSHNPNFQNLQKEKKDKSDKFYTYAFIIKHSVIAPEDFDMLCADYSQLEYRLLAHCSGDKRLIEGYCSGDLDIHILVASDLFDIVYVEVTPDQRQEGKTLNFGIVYGKGEKALARDLKCSVEEARGKLKRYFARYPGVLMFIKETKREIVRKGYVTTITGRRRRIPEVYSDNRYMREAALRQAVNSIIQGSATGDINKMAIRDLHDKLVDDKRIFLPLDVHDELVLYCHKSISEEVAPEMKSIMESVYKLKVPLIADVEVKSRWVE